MELSDFIAGIFLLLFGLAGIGLYILIILSMVQIAGEITGFRFLISQALTDVLLLIQFGVWPGIIILCQKEFIPISWRWHLHVYLDFTWWAMAYHYTVIAWSRYAAVQWPSWFRTLPYGTSILICAFPWFFGLLQSMVEHQFLWFEPLFYNSKKYGLDSEWEKYEANGTHVYYMVCNTVLMILPFPLYTAALAALFRRQRQRSLGPQSHYRISSSTLNTVQRQMSIETRLLIPCIINTILFVIGQIFLTQCSKHGKWMNWAVMVIFATNSFVNPLLYLFFSSVIRRSVISGVQKKLFFSAMYDYELRFSILNKRSSLIRLNKDVTVSSNISKLYRNDKK